jgi:hypothetical protein
VFRASELVRFAYDEDGMLLAATSCYVDAHMEDMLQPQWMQYMHDEVHIPMEALSVSRRIDPVCVCVCARMRARVGLSCTRACTSLSLTLFVSISCVSLHRHPCCFVGCGMIGEPQVFLVCDGVRRRRHLTSVCTVVFAGVW